MPIKFKPSAVSTVKQSNGSIKRVQQHYYMKATSTKDILEAYNRASTLPKLKDKMKKELNARGVLDADI